MLISAAQFATHWHRFCFDRRRISNAGEDSTAPIRLRLISQFNFLSRVRIIAFSLVHHCANVLTRVSLFRVRIGKLTTCKAREKGEEEGEREERWLSRVIRHWSSIRIGTNVNVKTACLNKDAPPDSSRIGIIAFARRWQPFCSQSLVLFTRAFSANKSFPMYFTKARAGLAGIRYTFVKFSRRSRRFLGGAPRYVLHLRHTAVIKFISQKKKPSPSRNVPTTDMPCQRSDELRRICVTNYINVTKVDVANVTRGIKCLILSALAFIRFQRPWK